MNTIIVNTALESDLDWVNSKYDEIGFVRSNFENEHILIASVSNQRAGLGRLVRIDSSNMELGGIYVFPEYRGAGVADVIVRKLCQIETFGKLTTWCLPFENLFKFYERFGFLPSDSIQPPSEIVKKFEWCNSQDKYKQKVLLLVKQ